MTSIARRLFACAPLALATTAMAWPALAQAPIAIKTQTAPAAQLEPGLAAAFFYAGFRNVNDVIKYVPTAQPSKTSTLAQIDGENAAGLIFQAGRYEQYAMHITGQLRFPRPGAWSIQVKSNDGVRVDLDGKKVLEDPEVHADRIAGPVVLNVAAGGVAPLEIFYFQNRAGAALVLQWAEPGSAEMKTIPASAFWQRKQ